MSSADSQMTRWTLGLHRVAAISYIQTVPKLRKAASTSTGHTKTIGSIPSDFSATTSFVPVIRPKTLLTE